MNHFKWLSTMSMAILVIALLSGVTSPVQAQEEIYKWVDADGVTHFSARPPEGIEYQRINTFSNVVQTVSPQSVGESDSDERTANTGLMPTLPEVEIQQPDPEVVAERCEQARSNLSWMTQRVRLNRENDQGQMEAISEEQRQQMIQQSRDFISEWC